MKRTVASLLAVATIFAGCATQQLVVDPKTIQDQAKFEQDKQECKVVSETYDQSEAVVGDSVLGAVAGGSVVAGIAAAVAGAVFLPAVPFIVAGTLIAGAASGGSAKADETAAREKIWVGCLNDRGYKAYSTK